MKGLVVRFVVPAGSLDEAKAKALACPSGPCEIARVDRTPFAQTYDFRTTPGTVTIRCARGAVFFGDYECARR